MGVIVTKYTTSSSASGGGAYNVTEKLAMEMEMEFKAANASYYKELVYKEDNPNKGALVSAGIWVDSNKTTRLFSKDLIYNAQDALYKTLLLRESDSAQLLKIFAYDDKDNLTSVTVSAG